MLQAFAVRSAGGSVGPLLGTTLMMVLAAAVPLRAQSSELALRRQAVDRVHQLRATVREPAPVASQHWSPLVVQQAVNYCDPGLAKTLERFGRDCGVEAGKVGPSLLRLAEILGNPGRLLYDDPLRPSLVSQLGQAPPGAGQTVEDLANVVGVPVSAFSCITKGVVRARYGETEATETVIRGVDGATDLYQLAGLTKAVGSGARNVGQIQKEIGKAFQSDPSGALDTALGPTQASGWFDRIGAAWNGMSYNQWRDAVGVAEGARGAFESCQVEGALELQRGVLPRVLIWSGNWRNWIRLAELERFCFEISWASQLGFSADSGGNELEHLLAGYQSDLDDLKGLDILDPAWARPESIAAKRREVAEIGRQIEHFEKLANEAKDQGCDVGSALAALNAIDQNSACFKIASGAGDANKFARLRDQLRELQLAHRDLRPSLSPAALEGANRLAACDLVTFGQPLRAAIIDFDRRHPRYPASSLRSCWPGDWPVDALAQEGARRDQELTRATREARDHQEAAQTLIDACRFDEAEPLLQAAWDGVVGTGCPVDDSVCSSETYDPVLCSLQLVVQAVNDARIEIADRRLAFEEAAKETRRVGSELMDWATSLELGADRCVAVLELPGIAIDLDRLGPPVGCDPSSVPELAAYHQRATDLRLLVLGISERERREIEGAVERARRFYGDCDSGGLEAVAQELEVLEVEACAESNRGPEIARWLQELEESSAEAERIERESNAKLLAWSDHCEDFGFAGFEAGVSNLPSCGWKEWVPERKGELLARLKELELIQAVRLPALEVLRRQLEARLAVGQGYVNSVSEAVGLGLEACRAKSQLERVVAEAEAWLARSSQEVATDPSFPLVCYGERLSVLRDLESDLQRQLAAVAQDCPEPNEALSKVEGDESEWQGTREEGSAGGEGEWVGTRQGGEQGVDVDPACVGRRPVYEAALQQLVFGTNPYDPDLIKAALARLSPPECPGDRGRLARLREPVLAAAQAEASANTQDMLTSSARARSRAQSRAAALSSLVGIAQRELDAYQRAAAQSASKSPGSGSGASAATGASQGAAGAAGSGRQCLFDPGIADLASGSGAAEYYVEESRQTSGGITFNAYKIWKIDPKDVASLGSPGRTLHGGYSLAGAQSKLNQLCPPSQRGTGSLRFD